MDTPLSKELARSLLEIQGENDRKRLFGLSKQLASSSSRKLSTGSSRSSHSSRSSRSSSISKGSGSDTHSQHDGEAVEEVNKDGENDEACKESKTLANIALRNKILAIGRLSRMFNLLRQESEKVEQLRAYSGGLTLPKGVLIQGSDELDKQLSHFERVRLADLSNEAVPPSAEEQSKEDDSKYKRLWERVAREV